MQGLCEADEVLDVKRTFLIFSNGKGVIFKCSTKL